MITILARGSLTMPHCGASRRVRHPRCPPPAMTGRAQVGLRRAAALPRDGHTMRGGLVRYLSVALYAAYGSNMDPAQMAERCPHSPQRGSGWLEGWRLAFGGEDIGWEGAMATVVEAAGQRVFVVLY